MVVRVAAPEEALEKLRAVVARGGLSVVIGGAAVVATLLVVAGNVAAYAPRDYATLAADADWQRGGRGDISRAVTAAPVVGGNIAGYAPRDYAVLDEAQDWHLVGPVTGAAGLYNEELGGNIAGYAPRTLDTLAADADWQRGRAGDGAGLAPRRVGAVQFVALTFAADFAAHVAGKEGALLRDAVDPAIRAAGVDTAGFSYAVSAALVRGHPVFLHEVRIAVGRVLSRGVGCVIIFS